MLGINTIKITKKQWEEMNLPYIDDDNVLWYEKEDRSVCYIKKWVTPKILRAITDEGPCKYYP